MRTHAILALTTLLGIAVRGYQFGVIDQTYYLPLLFKWNDPSMFPHDAFVSPGLGRSSPIWTLVAFAARVVDLRVLSIILYLATAYLTLLVTFKIALLLWKDGRAAWLAVLLWVPAHPLPGLCFTTFEPYFSARLVGALIGLALLYAFLTGNTAKWTLALLGGVTLYFLMVVPVGAGMGVSNLVRRKWRALLLMAAATLAGLALLMVFWRLTGYHRSTAALYSDGWYELLKAFYQDLLPTTWGWEVWARYGLYSTGFVAVCVQLAHSNRTRMGAVEMMLLGGPMILLTVLGTGVLALWPLITLAQLSLPRAFLFVIFLFTLGLAAVLVPHLEAAGWLRAALSSTCLACWLTTEPWFEVAGLGLIALLAVWERSACAFRTAGAWLAGSPRRLLCLLAAFTALLGIRELLFRAWGVDVLVWSWRGFAPPRETALWVATFVFLFLCWRGLIKGWGGARRSVVRGEIFPVLLAVLLLLAPSPFLLETCLNHSVFRMVYGPMIPSRIREADKRHREAMRRIAMERMVVREVPREAMVIVPADWLEFRMRTGRSSFVTWKDRGPAAVQRPIALIWLQRMREIHAIRQNAIEEEPTPLLPAEEAKALALKYQGSLLRYIVTAQDYPFRLIGRKGPYKLYLLPAPD